MSYQLCDPNRLSSFVQGRLSAEDEWELTAHLDECETCGTALEYQVADASVWSEASAFLADQKSQNQEADFSVANSCESQITLVLSQLSPTDDPSSLGRIGGYEVTGVIGSGGMGVVLKARDHSLDRIVAVKVMAPHLAASGSARQRFSREGKAAAAVLHPNVIAIHSVSNEDELPYLVMPYVRGKSLQKRIDDDGPLPLVEILRIGAQVAAGLAAAHEQGLVHRDIKPANILLENGVERVTITDFGLARTVDDASMTRSGVIAGTPQYMSPEQARGEPIDARSDLFSLGSLLYAMCTGHSPFRAETSFGVVHRIVNDSPRPIAEINPDIPPWLEGFVMKLLSKRADDRFHSADEVAELLEGCLSHTQHPGTTQLPVRVNEIATKPSRVRRWRKFATLSLCSSFAFLVGVLLLIEANNGTLQIETNSDAEVPVTIRQGKEVVEHLMVSREGTKIRLAAGNYIIEVDEEGSLFTINDNHVTLKRGDTWIAKITLGDSTLRPGGTTDRRSPFTDVDFKKDGKIIVTFDGQKYEWLAIDGVNVSDLIAASKIHYSNQWQKRIAEDLIELLMKMGKQPGESADLSLRNSETGQVEEFKNVPMTEENRSQIYRKRNFEGDVDDAAGD